MLWYTIAMELTDSIAAKHRFARFAAMVVEAWTKSFVLLAVLVFIGWAVKKLLSCTGNDENNAGDGKWFMRSGK